MVSLLHVHVLYSQKFSPEEDFHQFHHLFLSAKFLSANFLSCVNDYMEDIALNWQTIIPLNISVIQRFLQDFCPVKIFSYTVVLKARYLHVHVHVSGSDYAL